MPPPNLRYTITADHQCGSRKETRVTAASAMCLADDWAERGCINVLVTDAFDVALGRDDFRATLPIVRRMAKQRK